MNSTTNPYRLESASSSGSAAGEQRSPGSVGNIAGLGRRSPDWTPSSSGSRSIAATVADAPLRPLTEREKQILRLVCDGLSNTEIAVRLGISSETVKSELKRIFRKIDVKNRTQAAVLLVRQGLV